MHFSPNRSAGVRAYPSRVCPVLAVLLAVSAGCGGVSTPDDTAAQTVIEQFHEQIRTGDVDAAWESTTADFKSDEGRDAFKRFVKSRPILAQPLEFVELKQVEVNGLTRWEATLRPAADQKSSTTVVKTMIAEEAGVWKVERLIEE